MRKYLRMEFVKIIFMLKKYSAQLFSSRGGDCKVIIRKKYLLHGCNCEALASCWYLKYFHYHLNHFVSFETDAFEVSDVKICVVRLSNGIDCLKMTHSTVYILLSFKKITRYRIFWHSDEWIFALGTQLIMGYHVFFSWLVQS